MDVINRDAVAVFVTKDTSLIREIAAPRNSSLERQSLAEATLTPGMQTQAHLHPDTEEVYYILRGTGRMAIESDQRDVGVNDAIVIRAGQRHQIRNSGEGDLVFLCCCVPAYSDADTQMCDPMLR